VVRIQLRRERIRLSSLFGKLFSIPICPGFHEIPGPWRQILPSRSIRQEFLPPGTRQSSRAVKR
jgi:hypothetical protein